MQVQFYAVNFFWPGNDIYSWMGWRTDRLTKMFSLRKTIVFENRPQGLTTSRRCARFRQQTKLPLVCAINFKSWIFQSKYNLTLRNDSLAKKRSMVEGCVILLTGFILSVYGKLEIPGSFYSASFTNTAPNCWMWFLAFHYKPVGMSNVSILIAAFENSFWTELSGIPNYRNISLIPAGTLQRFANGRVLAYLQSLRDKKDVAI